MQVEVGVDEAERRDILESGVLRVRGEDDRTHGTNHVEAHESAKKRLGRFIGRIDP